MARNKLANGLTGYAVDEYIDQISNIIASSPANGADLLAQLRTFDDAAQDERVKQALRLYSNVRMSSASDVALVDGALAAV